MTRLKVRRRILPSIATAALFTLMAGGVSAGQTPRPLAPRLAGRAVAAAAAATEGISVNEVQRLFDAYTAMQAEGALNLSDTQYPQFLSRLRALQETRRRHLQGRNQIVQELVRLTNPKTGAGDEAQIRERLKALGELDAQAASDIRSAYDAVDQVLDVRQQARFRILEVQLERRKFDMLARARRGASGEFPLKPPGPPK